MYPVDAIKVLLHELHPLPSFLTAASCMACADHVITGIDADASTPTQCCSSPYWSFEEHISNGSWRGHFQFVAWHV